MKAPTFRDSDGSCLARGLQVLLRAKAWFFDQPAYQEFSAMQDRYSGAHEQAEAAKHAKTDALLARRKAVKLLVRCMRWIALLIRALTDGRRESDLLRRYFPNGLGAVMRRRPPDLLAAAAGLLAALEQETEPELLARKAGLQAAYDGLVQANAAEQAALEAIGQTKSNRAEAALVWRKAWSSLYYDMRQSMDDRRTVEWVFEEAVAQKTGTEASEEDPAQNGGTAPPAQPSTPTATT